MNLPSHKHPDEFILLKRYHQQSLCSITSMPSYMPSYMPSGMEAKPNNQKAECMNLAR